MIQAKSFLQGDVINATKMHEELKSLHASLSQGNEASNEADQFRASVRTNKKLIDLFSENDNSTCKVFSLQINTAKVVYSDFKKNKFLDSRLLAILENT